MEVFKVSAARQIWWQYVKGMIRQYPRIKDSTCLPTHKLTEVEAVRKAIDDTLMLEDGALRMRLVKLLYWDRKWHRLEDAAGDAFCSVGTARKWHRDFVYLVAAYRGLWIERG